MTPERQTTVLSTLNALATNPNLTQRSLAKEMSVALGAANAHMQYCIRSGFIRKNIVGRTGYQITEKGWQVHKQIKAEAYKNKLVFNNNIKEEYQTLMKRLSERGFTSFLIQGTNTLSDIAFVAAKSINMPVDGFIDTQKIGLKYMDTPIVKDASALLPQQAILFTEIDNAQETFVTLSKQAGRRRVAIPQTLQSFITTKDLGL